MREQARPPISMMTTSKPLFVYLQRPGSSKWITVGRYTRPQGGRAGTFRYAQSYVEAGHSWSIDPINIPFIGEVEHQAYRYHGRHDVLRDTTPDARGRLLLQRGVITPETTTVADINWIASMREFDLAASLSLPARPGARSAAATSRQPHPDCRAHTPSPPRTRCRPAHQAWPV